MEQYEKIINKEMQEWTGKEHLPQFLQLSANKICFHFGLEPIPIQFFQEGGKQRGVYIYSRRKPRLIGVNMATKESSSRKAVLGDVIATLLHELAHHLHDHYQCLKINGCRRTDKSHGKEFLMCFKEITGFHSNEHSIISRGKLNE